VTISKLIGKPYKNNGRGPDYFDCYGIVKYIYKNFLGIDLPEYTGYSEDWYKNSNVLTEQLNIFSSIWYSVDIPKKWDILTFSHGVSNKITNHCGVYLGEDKMIHCYENSPVVIDRITRPYWNKNMTGIMRYKECQS
jgi:cell wall-associated NlpC family hydrolase